MGIRRNLSTNPALAIDASAWFGPSGWARTTAADASLPRTTAFAGTTAGGVATPRVDVTPGAIYLASVSARFVTAVTAGTLSIDWYDSTGTYLSSSSSTGFTGAAGTTARLERGPIAAPSGAASATLYIGGLNSGQLTAHLFELNGTAGAAYFDGASTSPKANWEGAAGASPSNELTRADSIGWSESASKISTAAGPAGTETATWGESAAIVGRTTAMDQVSWSESGLIVSVGYDDLRGRIRVSAFGLPAAAVRAVVYSRAVNVARYTPVRGGRVQVLGGRFVRTVDDYEFTAGLDQLYRLDVLSSPENSSDVLVGRAIVRQPAPLAHVWLKFIASPHLNTRVRLTGWGPVERDDRNTTYPVRGRPEPVVITDVHGARTTTITLRTETASAGDALDLALGSGAPIFLHVPVGVALPSLYAVVGRYSWVSVGRSMARIWTVPLTEVAAPPPSIVGAGVSWANIRDTYATWGDLLAARDTWAAVVS